jgi:cation diffusion facilitator CzcD-associated flavoprotein CzcO
MTSDRSNAPEHIPVVIVGAGPAGLAVGGCLRRRQIPFVLLERHEQVATAWRQHYERLHLHTTKRFSSLPYLRFPAHVPRYPSRQQVVDYLDAYTQRFDLQPRCGQNVVSVQRTEAGWKVETEGDCYIADSVVMSTGLNETPRLPTWPDQERFRGRILHSSQYHHGEPYRNQRVLVVGFGNSGAEIAMDLYEQGATVGMVVRSPVNVVFQDRFGIPNQVLAILLSPLPPRTLDAIIRPVMRATFGDLTTYGLRHALDGVAMQLREHSKVPVIDKGTIAIIKQGRIKVFPGLERFTPEGVEFSDGTLASWDAVVLATGYGVRLASLLHGCDGVLDTHGVPRESWRATAIPGLYFCGFRNDIAGLLRQIGHEAQHIAAEISDTYRGQRSDWSAASSRTHV